MITYEKYSCVNGHVQYGIESLNKCLECGSCEIDRHPSNKVTRNLKCEECGFVEEYSYPMSAREQITHCGKKMVVLVDSFPAVTLKGLGWVGKFNRERGLRSKRSQKQDRKMRENVDPCHRIKQ